MKDLIIALITVTVAAFLIMKKDTPLLENYGGIPQQMAVHELEYAIPDPSDRSQANLYGVPPVQRAAFFSNPAYQADIEPRASMGVGLGANIRYNPPKSDYMAVPKNPLTYGRSMVDNLPSGGLPSCSAAGSSIPPCNKQTRENFVPIGNNRPSMEYYKKSAPRPSQAPAESPFLSNTALAKENLAVNEGAIPLATDSKFYLEDPSSDKGPQQVRVIDRFIFANAKSRLQSVGVDRIRGDIPIAPSPCGNFDPSVKPERDLVLGALATIGGLQNDTHNEVRALQNKYASNTDVYSDYSSFVNPVMAQTSIGLSGDATTLNAIAFP